MTEKKDMQPAQKPGRILTFIYAAVADIDPVLAAQAIAREFEFSGGHCVHTTDALYLIDEAEKDPANGNAPALLRSNLLSIMRRSDQVWGIGPDRSLFVKEEQLANMLELPFKFIECGTDDIPSVNLEDLRCAVHYTGKMQECEVTSVLQLSSGPILPVPSPTELKRRGGCFGTAAERHIAELDAYIETLQQYRDQVLGTSRMYNEAIRTGPFFR